MKRPARFSVLITLALAGAWLASSPALASDAATLSGRVYTIGSDQVQAVWPNARVTLKNLRSGAAVSTVSSGLGEYRFSGLEPGEYELSVSLSGFETAVRQVKLEPKAESRVDIALRPKAQSERVVVQAETQGVDVTSTSSAGPTLNQSTLQSLPLVNEQFQDALPLLPGVVRGPDGLINIKGARSYQSGTLVNSISAVDPVTGQSSISLPLEAVQSVKVLPDPFSAEYGLFAGGITEVQTRNGTDEWKFLFTDFFPRIRVRDGTITGLESITPRLTFAGPLEKDKLFLFQSFQYRFVRTPVYSLPPLQRDSQFETFDSYTRFDWNITPNQLFTGSLSAYPQNLRFANLNTFNPEETTPNFRQRGYFMHLNERAIFSGGGFLESSFSIKRYDAHIFPAQQGDGEFSLFPEQNFGNWYNQEDRESHVFEWVQNYHARPLKTLGTHLITAGYSYNRLTYDGQVQNSPLVVLREDRTISQQISFIPQGAAALGQDQNVLAAFVQDQWALLPRFTLNLGLRLDRQDLSSDRLNPAPRLAFVLSPTRDNKTALRGGIGLFYSRMPLNLGAFLAYPAEIVTQLATDGVTVVQGPTTFVHRVATSDGRLHVPYSLTWNFQVDRELRRGLLFRFGYEQRKTHRDFFVDPLAAAGTSPAQLLLFNNGRQDYQEFQWTLRWDVNARTTLFYSFVLSHAAGDLNDFEQFFDNFANPIIRPNQHQPLPYDAPNRFLFWGRVGLPWKLEFSPVLDIHNGFPFSKVDNDLNFIGARNRAGRFPTFGALDFQLVRPFRLRAFGRSYHLQAGLKMFNVTNHFNPRDVQENTASPNFGAFYNSVGRQLRAKFEFDF